MADTTARLAPRSQRAWENFRRRVAELGGEVLESAWLGKSVFHRCWCAAAGHLFSLQPANTRQNRGGCPVCAREAESLRLMKDFRSRIAKLGGVVLEPEWRGALTAHHCRCVNGHECWSRPNDVQQGDGICRICATQNRVDPRSQPAWNAFRQRVTELGGVVLESAWLGSGTPHACLCVNGHECRPTPGNIHRGDGLCRVCAGNDPATAWDNFRSRIAELGGAVLEPAWLGKDAPHRCRCAGGHECQPRPGSIQQGNGMCPICAGKDSATAWNNFRKRVSELGGTVLEPAWSGAQTPHLCLCLAGHECWPSPNNIQQGGGICRICADVNNPETARQKAIAQELFRRRITALGGMVLEPNWLGVEEPHLCRCPAGHVCSPRPHSVQGGQGMCAICGWRGQDALYVVRNPMTGCIKFGITNQDGSIRLGNHRRDGFIEMLFLKTGLPVGLAAYTEQKIKIALAMAGEKPVQGREYFSDGNTALVLNEIGNWMP